MNTADQVFERIMHSMLDAHINRKQKLLEILENLLAHRNYTQEDMRGLSVILKYMRKVEQVNMSTVDMTDMETVSSFLKGLKAPFAAMRDGNTDHCIFITRNTAGDKKDQKYLTMVDWNLIRYTSLDRRELVDT